MKKKQIGCEEEGNPDGTNYCADCTIPHFEGDCAAYRKRAKCKIIYE